MIVWFVVFDAMTGDIKRCGTCPQDMVSIQADAGEGVMEVDAKASSETHYVELTEPPQLKAR